jgi:hypothetical protein
MVSLDKAFVTLLCVRKCVQGSTSWPSAQWWLSAKPSLAMSVQTLPCFAFLVNSSSHHKAPFFLLWGDTPWFFRLWSLCSVAMSFVPALGLVEWGQPCITAPRTEGNSCSVKWTSGWAHEWCFLSDRPVGARTCTWAPMLGDSDGRQAAQESWPAMC